MKRRDHAQDKRHQDDQKHGRNQNCEAGNPEALHPMRSHYTLATRSLSSFLIRRVRFGG